MPEIKLLNKDISELIAAGEVIERPASVIKELVENSIDAGAKFITVEIRNGGTEFMRVTDDGCGMSYDDVPIAFMRHATSKISNKDDLNSIYTLGFRGEALASVSAVSKVEVMTKRKADEYGTRYVIKGGEEKLHEKSGCPDGTSIVIRDLFFNIPVRRNFLRRDTIEAGAVRKIIHKIALSHPEISFKFIRNNKVEFHSAGDNDLYSTIYAVYGKDFVKDILPVNYTEEDITITGYIVRPLYSKGTRALQNFFVNGRYVKSVICQAALESGYESMLLTGKFPGCVMMIDIPPSMIDVNIHPTKAEVRFADEHLISDVIFHSVKSAMITRGFLYEFQFEKKHVKIEEEPEISDYEEQRISIFVKPEDIERVERKPEFDLIIPKLPKKSESDIDPKRINEADIFIDPEEDEILEAENNNYKQEIIQELPPENIETETPEVPENPYETQNYNYISQKSFEKPENSEAEECDFPKCEIRVIGEAFKNYIMAEVEDKVIMIDKHAAHERVIFERLKSENCRQYMQMFLEGSKILLSEEEFDALEVNEERLENMGFSFDFSQKPYIVTKGIPEFLTDLNMDEVIPELAENFVKCVHDPQAHIIDDVLHDIACKSAIKANDRNDITELQRLAEIVYNDENIRHCPHGRPVMFTMSKNNIERQFKRKL